jgi:hypothetical protein
VSDAYYDEFNRRRTFRENLRSLPVKFRVLFAVGIFIAAGAVLYGVGFGVYSLFWFNHHEQSTCMLTSFDGPHPNRNDYWNVRTSCGSFVLNAAPGEINVSQAQLLVDTFQTGHIYRFTFVGWGSGREIIGATQL